MIPEQFQILFDNTILELKKLREQKGGEYAGDDDCLANFKRNAFDCGLRMEQVWRIYAGKHWDAITQHVKDISTGTNRIKSEPIEGRIDDLLVYLILFKAILQEQRTVAAKDVISNKRLPAFDRFFSKDEKE